MFGTRSTVKRPALSGMTVWETGSKINPSELVIVRAQVIVTGPEMGSPFESTKMSETVVTCWPLRGKVNEMHTSIQARYRVITAPSMVLWLLQPSRVRYPRVYYVDINIVLYTTCQALFVGQIKIVPA